MTWGGRGNDARGRWNDAGGRWGFGSFECGMDGGRALLLPIGSGPAPTKQADPAYIIV